MRIPESQEAEQQAVGCCIIDPKWIAELNLEWFRDFKLRAVCQLLKDMQDAGEYIDQVSLQLKIRKAGKESEVGLTMDALAADVISPAGFPEWAKILDEKLVLRSIFQLCTTFSADACSEEADAEKLVEEFEQKALSVRLKRSGVMVDVKAELQKVVDGFEQAFLTQGKIRGLATGFVDFDRITNGLRPGQLFIIAARPSVGKTSLVMNIAENVAVDAKIPVGIFSLEMSAAELLTRMLCGRSKISQEAAQSGDFKEKDFVTMGVEIVRLAGGKLQVCESSELTIGQIRAIARKLKQEEAIKLVIVDYLQLVSSGAKRVENQNSEITVVSRGLKAMAKELQIPVIALAQLNRDVEKTDRKPKLSDLRGSGSIEQDADIVGLLHREKNEGEEIPIDLIIAKNRNGRTDLVPLLFQRQFTTFKPRGHESTGEGI